MIREYLANIGRKGGKARASKYDKATLSKWAKKGGRLRNPRKANKPLVSTSAARCGGTSRVRRQVIRETSKSESRTVGQRS